MTQLLYRLDDKVTASYAEFLEKKGDCKVAYHFFIEGRTLDAKVPETYAEVERDVQLPFFR